jgi:hypothetical protein
MTITTILSKESGPLGSVRTLWAELGTNRRAQAGLLIVGILLAGYGLVALHGASARLAAGYDRDYARLQRIAGIAQEREWPERAAASASLLTAFEQRLWAAESAGVAQANLQGWISGVGREIGMPMFDIRVQTAKPKGLPPDLLQITATITGQPSETAVIALLERIEQAPHLTVVSRLHVRQQPDPLLELVLVAYARIGPSGQGGAK